MSMETSICRRYEINILFLDGKTKGYTVTMTAKKRIAHGEALFKMRGVRFVEISRLS